MFPSAASGYTVAVIFCRTLNSHKTKSGVRMNRLGRCGVVLQVVIGCISTVGLSHAQSAPDLNRGQQIAERVCVTCHSADGNSASGAFPKLAGQHQAYLIKQINDFKIQPGAKAALRNNPVMVAYASALSDQDITNVTAYFAAQTPKPGYAHDKSAVTLGQQIYRGGIASKGVPACAGCHGPTGQGIPIQYPRLSWQWADYVVTQLHAYQQGPGGRNNNEAMHAIALRLSDNEIKAVADYIAGLH